MDWKDAKVGTVIVQRYCNAYSTVTGVVIAATAVVVRRYRKPGGHRRVIALARAGTYNLTDNDLFNWAPASAASMEKLGTVNTLAEKRIGDGYWHYAATFSKARDKVWINAGCQCFRSIAMARKHWTVRRRWDAAYPGSKERMVYGSADRYGIHKTKLIHTTQVAARYRAKDRVLNKFSLAFVRKVERMLAKSRQ